MNGLERVAASARKNYRQLVAGHQDDVRRDFFATTLKRDWSIAQQEWEATKFDPLPPTWAANELAAVAAAWGGDVTGLKMAEALIAGDASGGPGDKVVDVIGPCDPPSSNNMGGRNRREVAIEGKNTVFHSLIDTLHVAVSVRWEAAPWKQCCGLLDQLKEQAQDDKDSTIPGYSGQACGSWAVAPSGTRYGANGFCAWQIACEGIRLQMIKRADGGSTGWNVKAQIGSVALMRFGVLGAWLEIRRLLEHLGGVVELDTVSRCDITSDVEGLDFQEVLKKFQGKHWISRVRSNKAVYGTHTVDTGFHIGREIMFRCYDKLAEIVNSPVKCALLASRSGGQLPQHLTRFEWELKREKLKEKWSVGGIVDLLQKLPGIVEELFGDTFRFTDHEVDRDNGHQAKARLWDYWVEAARSLIEWAGCPFSEAPRKRECRIPVPKHLLAMAEGCLAKAAAVVGSRTSWQFLRVLNSWVNEWGPERINKKLKAAGDELEKLGIALPVFGEVGYG